MPASLICWTLPLLAPRRARSWQCPLHFDPCAIWRYTRCQDGHGLDDRGNAGGLGVLRARLADYAAVIQRTRAGLPYGALEAVAKRYAIPLPGSRAWWACPPAPSRGARRSASSPPASRTGCCGWRAGGRRRGCARRGRQGRAVAAEAEPRAPRCRSPRSPRHRPRRRGGRDRAGPDRARRVQLIRVWRLTQPHTAAFDGTGARRYGGRWNPRGTAVVYTSATLSLAVMELLVHLDDDDLAKAYVGVPAVFPMRWPSPASAPPIFRGTGEGSRRRRPSPSSAAAGPPRARPPCSRCPRRSSRMS